MMQAMQATIPELVAGALAEDVGDGDITTDATVPAGARARATITQKSPGVVFGIDIAEQVFRALDPGVALERLTAEGQWREGGPVLRVEGSAPGDPDRRADRAQLLGRACRALRR